MRLRAEPVEGTEPIEPAHDSDSLPDVRQTLTEHLDELRKRLVRSLLIVCAAWVVGWIIQPILYDALNDLIVRNITAVLQGRARYQEAFRNATDIFMLKLKLSLMIGIFMAFPFVLLQLWGFVRPGLKPRERAPIERLAPFSVALFALGAFCCWMILPAALRWFASFLDEFPGADLIQEPGAMVFFVIKMMLAFGIGFQLPVVVYALGAMGLLSANTLLQYWRQSAVVIFMVSAVLTPSADAFSMLMMAIPLLLLFTVSVLAVRITQRRKGAQEADNGWPAD